MNVYIDRCRKTDSLQATYAWVQNGNCESLRYIDINFVKPSYTSAEQWP